MTFEIMQGDCLGVMRSLPDSLVDCCITSPPYFGLRDYGVDGQIGLEDAPCQYVDRLVCVFRELRRILKDEGTFWLNIGDSYAASCLGEDPQYGVVKQKDVIGIPWMLAFALRKDGWYLRQDIIWDRPNSMPEGVTDRCTKAHEHIFLFSKSRNYFFDHKSIQEPANYDGRKDTFCKGGEKYRDIAFLPGNRPLGESFQSKPHQRWQVRDEAGGGKDEGGVAARYVRNKRDVWHVPSSPYGGAHFAAYPVRLVEPCVMAGCPVGGLVLDPFSGSGTTGIASLNRGRRFLGIELNPEYAELSRKRISSETSQELLPGMF